MSADDSTSKGSRSVDPKSIHPPGKRVGKGGQGSDLSDLQLGGTSPLRPLPDDKVDVQPQQVIFQTMTPEAQVFGIHVDGVVVVGRADPKHETKPDLDLTPYGAEEHGVSRRHAILFPSEEGICLIDLESMNGTWLNGLYLQPGQKYRLRSGDRIEFGTLKLTVRLAGTPQVGSNDESTVYTRSKPKRR